MGQHWYKKIIALSTSTLKHDWLLRQKYSLQQELNPGTHRAELREASGAILWLWLKCNWMTVNSIGHSSHVAPIPSLLLSSEQRNDQRTVCEWNWETIGSEWLRALGRNLRPNRQVLFKLALRLLLRWHFAQAPLVWQLYCDIDGKSSCHCQTLYSS